jgi:hypothetical protein
MSLVALVALLCQSQRFPETDARKIIETLASPTFSGRSATTPEFMAAAKWCTDWLKQAGVPAGVPDYLQRFKLEQIQADPANQSAKTDDGKLTLEPGAEFLLRSQVEVDATVSLAFVWCGKGASLPENQLAQLDEKIVFMQPGQARENPEFVAELRRRKPAAVLTIVATERLTAPPELRSQISASNRSFEPAGLRLNAKGFEAFNRAYDLATIAARTEGTAASAIVPGLHLAARPKVIGTFETANVVAKIEGSDPTLRSQAVVIGAHLDHLGKTATGYYPGADDNASGVASALLLAKAIMSAPTKPKRTVLVALWSGEEIGTFGSEYYCANPVIPMSQTIAYLNLDMLGRNSNNRPLNDTSTDHGNAVYAGIARLNSPELWELVHRANARVNLNLREDKDDRTSRSDTRNFVKHSVPTLKVWTGEHEDYHRVSDLADKINYPKLLKISEWLFNAAQELSGTAKKPAFLSGSEYVLCRWMGAEDLAVPVTAIATYELQETLSGRTVVLDKVTQKQPNGFPIRFTLRTIPAQLKSDATYRVHARIMEGANVLYETTVEVKLGENNRLPNTELPAPVVK